MNKEFYDLYLLQLKAMKSFNKMLFNKFYLYGNNKALRENFYIQYKWLCEFIEKFEKKQIIIKK